MFDRGPLRILRGRRNRENGCAVPGGRLPRSLLLSRPLFASASFSFSPPFFSFSFVFHSSFLYFPFPSFFFFFLSRFSLSFIPFPYFFFPVFLLFSLLHFCCTFFCFSISFICSSFYLFLPPFSFSVLFLVFIFPSSFLPIFFFLISFFPFLPGKGKLKERKAAVEDAELPNAGDYYAKRTKPLLVSKHTFQPALSHPVFPRPHPVCGNKNSGAPLVHMFNHQKYV